MTLRVGLIGLGVMGVPMAKNIAAAGLPLIVFNRSSGPARQFEGTAVRVAESAAEAFEASETIVLMLKDDAATDAVLGRKRDSFAVPLGGRIVVNAATLTPSYSEELGRAVEGGGAIYIEAPVSGSLAPAEKGELLVMTAGPEDAVARARPIFDAIGKKTVHCGLPPAAMRMKSASNLLLAGLMSGILESVNFARKTGLDFDRYAEVVLGGPMASDFLRMKLPKAVSEDYGPQAAVHNVRDSLDVALDEAERAGVAAGSARLLRQRCDEAVRRGFGDEDVLALLKAPGPAKGEPGR